MYNFQEYNVQIPTFDLHLNHIKIYIVCMMYFNKISYDPCKIIDYEKKTIILNRPKEIILLYVLHPKQFMCKSDLVKIKKKIKNNSYN